MGRGDGGSLPLWLVPGVTMKMFTQTHSPWDGNKADRDKTFGKILFKDRNEWICMQSTQKQQNK